MKPIQIITIFIVSCSFFLIGCEKQSTINEEIPLTQDTDIKQIKEGHRHGPQPETTDAPINTNIAHQQTSQNSPIEIQDQLWEYMSSLSGVVAGPTKISVVGARALFVPGTNGPTLAGDERVHLHPGYDGSLHIALDQETMQELVDTGWGEFHPRNKNSIMLYGPRDQEELDFIKEVISQGLTLHATQKETVKEIVPYSVEALKATNFSGHSLSLEFIENTTNVYTRYRIFYMSNGLRISGILNIPTGDGPFPLIILNHGYIDPAVYTVGRGLKREQDYLARAGFAVLHTDYRNHGLSDDDPKLFENYIFRNYFYTQDAINAILAVKNSNLPELQSINSEDTGMLGHSMGGGVTMHALIVQSNLIDAAVLYAPVHSTEWFNFNRWREDSLTEAEKNERTKQLGGLDVKSFMPYSATPYVNDIQSPIQIYFGTNDESVPYQWGVETNQILIKAGVESKLITFEGEKHEFVRDWNSFMKGVTEFFDIQLKKDRKS